MKGKLVVLEGVDGSGKSTQYGLLQEKLKAAGVPFRCITFPCYDSPSSAPVRMYLEGAFGAHPADVNCYAASTLYAVDRFASYKQDWGKWYESGGLVLAARYTTSNAIHQAVKLPESERAAFLAWLYDLEYEKMGLPRPDRVFFLDVPPEVSLKLLAARGTREDRPDIHEADPAYLRACYEGALYAAEASGWTRVRCTRGETLRPPEEISAELFAQISGLLSL